MTKAGAWRRFGARLVDSLVVGLPISLVAGLVGGGFGLVAGFVIAPLTYVYFVGMESQRGRTLGKQVFGLRVESAPGALVARDEAMRRNLFILLGAIPLGVLFYLSVAVSIAIGVTIARDPEGRGFHDKWAGTVVRRTTATPS